MIDKSFANQVVSFELSIGSSGYCTPDQLAGNSELPSSITSQFTPIPIDNNPRHFRLPIDLQKPVLFTKYIFHDYSYRMILSNRLKHAAYSLVRILQKRFIIFSFLIDLFIL